MAGGIGTVLFGLAALHTIFWPQMEILARAKGWQVEYHWNATVIYMEIT